MNDLQKYGKKWYLDSFRKFDQSLFMTDYIKKYTCTILIALWLNAHATSIVNADEKFYV